MKWLVRLYLIKASKVLREIKLPYENESFYKQNLAQNSWSNSDDDFSHQTINKLHDKLSDFLTVLQLE